MKITKITVFLLVTMVLVSGLLMAACATKKTGIKMAEKTTASLQTVDSDIRQTVSQIDATNASLNTVVNSKGSPDMQKAYDDYVKNVDRMDETGNALLKHMNQLATRGNNYFEEWQQTGTTYTNPEIQRLSQERRNEVQRAFSGISQSSIGVSGHLNSYLSNIKQIQKYLSNDLTAKGIEAITPVAEATTRAGNDVKASVQPMLTATARARSEMMEGGAAAGGTSPRSAPSGTTGTTGTYETTPEAAGTAGGNTEGSSY